MLNLLVPTQNNKNKIGEFREKWTVNPGANSTYSHRMYEFLGALIGMSVRSGTLLNLNLPGFIWKQLTDEEVTIDDLNDIDTAAVNMIKDLRTIRERYSEEEFVAGFDLNFTTILSNTDEVEIVPNGKDKRVDYSNLEEYIEKTIETRLKECQAQIRSIKKGIDISFNSTFLKLMCWKDLEFKVVGDEVVDLDRLKEITSYRVIIYYQLTFFIIELL